MEKTGVMATDEETEELRDLADRARKTPAMIVGQMGIGQALSGGGDESYKAWQEVRMRCHELAMNHGLPDIVGFYGLNGDGEFVKM